MRNMRNWMSWMSPFGVLVMMIVMIMATMVMGADLTAARNTPSKANMQVNLGVFTNTQIFAGAMVSVNSSGYAINSWTGAASYVVGRAAKTVDNRDNNSSGSSASGAQSIDVDVDCFGWANGDGITDADIGKIAYVSNNYSVCKGAYGANIVAGLIVDVDSSYVWVQTHTFEASGSTPASLAVSGNATVGGTITVTGATALNGGLTCDSTKFQVADTSGNIIGQGTIKIDGAGTIGGALTVSNTINNAGFSMTAGRFSTTGGVYAAGLPTSVPAAGFLWNSNGVIRVE